MKEKILIVLSDSTLASLLSSEFKKQGYSMIVVKNGEEALETMKVQLPDLALIDPVLPGKSGYDVLNEKTLDRDITKIPVIVISNTGSPLEMRRIPSTPSIRDYIIKTHIEPSEVFMKVEAAFGRAYNSAASLNAKAPVEKIKKILWVEDDKFLSMILVKKFDSLGYKVLKAANSDETFVILQNEVPDIIILDILLPGENGFDILQKIKMDARLKLIPVMILSNMSKPNDIQKAQILGANKFMVKAAVSLDEIVREVTRLTE